MLKSENCAVCDTSAELHVDERRNHHVSCPKCGGYIAAETFAQQFAKLEGTVQQTFAEWMGKNSAKPNRFLYKTKPLKSNPYSAADGFDMISISRIQSGTFDPEAKKEAESEFY